MLTGRCSRGGRNRITESSAPEGQIFGSRVAHAEVNALVQLGLERGYFECTLWTTLEPCAHAAPMHWRRPELVALARQLCSTSTRPTRSRTS